LGAYLTYHLAAVGGLSPYLAMLLIVPVFFGLGVALQAAFIRFRVGEFASLLVTFGITVVIEAFIQWVWTADFRRLEHATVSLRLGPLFVPLTEALMLAIAVALSLATWAWLRFTYVGKAMRAGAEDPGMAAAFGIDHRRLALLLSGVGAAYSGIAGAFVALIYTLAPAQIYAWIGVVFAVVILGRLGNPLGPVLAGLGVGVIEAITMAVTAPSWAPLVSFALLILVLLLRPDRI
jgi:branched-chain amino acid transport system permease protein